MKENWRVIFDGTMSSIERTDDEVDDYSVFASFAKAKKAMIEDYKSQIADCKTAIKIAKQLKKSAIKHHNEIYE